MALPTPRLRLHRPPRGAALATAMFFLVVITLLGVAAMRAGQVDLRMALNEESRVGALQSAQSLLDSLLNDRANLAINPGSGYVQNCFVATALDATALQTRQKFQCPNGSAAPTLPVSGISTYAYVMVYRESIGGADFAPVSALRRGDSGDRFRLASFTLTAGYDRTQASRASTSTDVGNFGAAEVSQGTFVKVDTVDGLVIQ